jgi:peptide/nickel transport system substrate-binding protein
MRVATWRSVFAIACEPGWLVTWQGSLRALLCALALAAGDARAASPPDVLVVAQSLDDIASLDPAEGFELSSVQAFTSLYQRLLQPDPVDPTVLRPTLAVRWQQGSTPKSLVFELRPDARFASGHPLRPEDVIFSLSRAVKLNRAPVFILNELGWRADNIEGQIAKLDDHRIEVRWSAEVGPAFVLSILTAPVASIVDGAEVESHASQGDAGNAWLRAHSAGSGPFRIRRYIPHEALVLDANPNSPGDVPSLRSVVIRNVTDAAVRRLLLEVGDADIARDLGPDQLSALAGKPHLKIGQYPSASVHYLLFNAANAANPVLANPALWSAARWLIDYDGLANGLLRGTFQVHQAFLAGGFPGALEDNPFHLDIARARAILDEAGLGHDIHIELDVFNQPPFVEIAQSLQSTFARAGIRVDIRPQLASQVYARVRQRAEQAVWLYWIPDYFDANSTAGAFALNREDGTETLAWRAGWRIPALSVQTQAAVAERDPIRRLSLYRQIQSEVQRNSPFVIALQERSQVAMHDGVQGYRQGLNADMVYYDHVTK